MKVEIMLNKLKSCSKLEQRLHLRRFQTKLKVEVPNFSPHQATALMEDEGSPGREMSETEVALPVNRDEEVMEVAVRALKGGFNFPEAETDLENNVLGIVHFRGAR